MYEVLNIKRMMRVKSQTVRNRTAPPLVSGNKKRASKWGGMILISAGTSIEMLNHIPSGSEIKLCPQDKSLWEVLIPLDYTKNIKLLAKRLDAVAFL
tara:strand:- start:77 stop:367 length:291 start_codon:yes stop_codon:yes gene_type:complete